jgi:hypothetical protein
MAHFFHELGIGRTDDPRPMPAHEIDSTNIRFERGLAEAMFGRKELPLRAGEKAHGIIALPDRR